MKVYVISVLHTRVSTDETGTEFNEVLASMPISVFTNKQEAIRTMQQFMEQEEEGSSTPQYNMFRYGWNATASLSESFVDHKGCPCRTEVTLRTIEADDPSFNIQDEVTAAWN